MKTLILTKTLLLFFLISYGQENKAILKNDTVYYKHAKFWGGQVIKLAYGSNPDKSFAFVRYGSSMTSYVNAHPQLAKSEVLINDVYELKGHCFVKGKIINSFGQFGMKILIDVEGVIDFAEIQ